MQAEAIMAMISTEALDTLCSYTAIDGSTTTLDRLLLVNSRFARSVHHPSAWQKLRSLQINYLDKRMRVFCVNGLHKWTSDNLHRFRCLLERACNLRRLALDLRCLRADEWLRYLFCMQPTMLQRRLRTSVSICAVSLSLLPSMPADELCASLKPFIVNCLNLQLHIELKSPEANTLLLLHTLLRTLKSARNLTSLTVFMFHPICNRLTEALNVATTDDANQQLTRLKFFQVNCEGSEQDERDFNSALQAICARNSTHLVELAVPSVVNISTFFTNALTLANLQVLHLPECDRLDAEEMLRMLCVIVQHGAHTLQAVYEGMYDYCTHLTRPTTRACAFTSEQCTQLCTHVGDWLLQRRATLLPCSVQLYIRRYFNIPMRHIEHKLKLIRPAWSFSHRYLAGDRLEFIIYVNNLIDIQFQVFTQQHY